MMLMQLQIVVKNKELDIINLEKKSQALEDSLREMREKEKERLKEEIVMSRSMALNSEGLTER